MHMPQNRLPVFFILITLVIDAMGIGLIMPVMPDLLREVAGTDLAGAAIWGGVMTFSFAVMQFLFGPTLGGLSDRFGRRPVLLVSLFVMAVDYLVMGLAGVIWLILIARIVGGITAATQSTAYAYIADISSPSEKAANFGLAGAAFGVGFVLGPLIGGVLGGYGTHAPFYAAALLALANMIFGYFVVKETVTADMRRPFDWRRSNPFGAITQMRKLPGVMRLIILIFFYEFAFIVYPVVWAYFTTAKFGWESHMIGMSLASFGVSMFVVQGFLIRPLMRILDERTLVLLGLGFSVMSFAIMAFLTNGMWALILTPISALGAVVNPALQSLMSQSVDRNAQGELQGVSSSARALAMILSPLVMTQIFAYFTASDTPFYLPGAPFLLSLALMTTCIIVFLPYRPSKMTQS